MASGKVVISSQDLQTMSLFTYITKATARDCIPFPTKMIFVVDEGQAGFAIGKAGSNVKLLEQKLGKKIRIIEHSNDPLQFVKNVVYPNRLAQVSVEGDVCTIIPVDHQTRGMLIGRSAQNLRDYEKIVNRYYDAIKTLKVSDAHNG